VNKTKYVASKEKRKEKREEKEEREKEKGEGVQQAPLPARIGIQTKQDAKPPIISLQTRPCSILRAAAGIREYRSTGSFPARAGL
jgi:hypothetical protein